MKEAIFEANFRNIKSWNKNTWKKTKKKTVSTKILHILSDDAHKQP